jgi:hypothetical protein
LRFLNILKSWRVGMEIKSGVKMKITGYICIAFAMLLTILYLMGKFEDSLGVKELITFWAGFGVTLLTINSTKKIVGNIAKSKQENM